MENSNFTLNLTWAGDVRPFWKIAIFMMNTKCFGTSTGKDKSHMEF